MYYKVGPVLLQSRAGITKWGNFYHKMGQLLQSSAVQQANERNGGGQYILATDNCIHT